MVCKKCGARLLEDDQFCPECGAKVIRRKRCPECGEPLREGTKFCPNCGTPVGEVKPVKRVDAGVASGKQEDSEPVLRKREDAGAASGKGEGAVEAPRKHTSQDAAEAPRKRTSQDAVPKKRTSPEPPPKKRPAVREEPRRRRDWEEDWDDEDDDDEEDGVDILSILTVAVGCILLVIVAVLGFNLYRRYVPGDRDETAQEQEAEGLEELEEDIADAEGDGMGDGQVLEEQPWEDGNEETADSPSGAAGTLVATHDVNIRDNPGTQGTNVIGRAKRGDSYEYAEVVEGGAWYRILLTDVDGYEYGYVSADYVEIQ